MCRDPGALHRIVERDRLGGTAVGPLGQNPCSSSVSLEHIAQDCFQTVPGNRETPRSLRATCSLGHSLTSPPRPLWYARSTAVLSLVVSPAPLFGTPSLFTGAAEQETEKTSVPVLFSSDSPCSH